MEDAFCRSTHTASQKVGPCALLGACSNLLPPCWTHNPAPTWGTEWAQAAEERAAQERPVPRVHPGSCCKPASQRGCRDGQPAPSFPGGQALHTDCPSLCQGFMLSERYRVHLPGDRQGGPRGSLTSPGRGAGPALRVRTKKPAAWWEAVGGQVPEQQSHPRETEASAQGGSAGVGRSADQGAGWAAVALHTWARLGEGCGGRRSPGGGRGPPEGGGWGLSFPRQEVVRKLGVLSREGGWALGVG